MISGPGKKKGNESTPSSVSPSKTDQTKRRSEETYDAWENHQAGPSSRSLPVVFNTALETPQIGSKRESPIDYMNYKNNAINFFLLNFNKWNSSQISVQSKDLTLPGIQENLDFCSDPQIRSSSNIKSIKMAAKLENSPGSGYIAEMFADTIDMAQRIPAERLGSLAPLLKSSDNNLKEASRLLRNLQEIRNVLSNVRIHHKLLDKKSNIEHARAVVLRTAAFIISQLHDGVDVLIPVDFYGSDGHQHAALMLLSDGERSNKCATAIWESNGLLTEPRMNTESLRKYQSDFRRWAISLEEALEIKKEKDQKSAKILPMCIGQVSYALRTDGPNESQIPRQFTIDAVATLLAMDFSYPGESFVGLQIKLLEILNQAGTFSPPLQRPHAIQSDLDCEWKSVLSFISSRVPAPIFEFVRAHCFSHAGDMLRTIPLKDLPGDDDQSKLNWKIEIQKSLSMRHDEGMSKAFHHAHSFRNI